MYDPDNHVMYTVHKGNMDWEKYHGYVALGVKEGGKDKDKTTPFRSKMLCNLIKETETQPAGVEIVKDPPEP